MHWIRFRVTPGSRSLVPYWDKWEKPVRDRANAPATRSSFPTRLRWCSGRPVTSVVSAINGAERFVSYLFREHQAITSEVKELICIASCSGTCVHFDSMSLRVQAQGLIALFLSFRS
jgi:hypothetical protein